MISRKSISLGLTPALTLAFVSLGGVTQAVAAQAGPAFISHRAV